MDNIGLLFFYTVTYLDNFGNGKTPAIQNKYVTGYYINLHQNGLLTYEQQYCVTQC